MQNNKLEVNANGLKKEEKEPNWRVFSIELRTSGIWDKDTLSSH